MSRVAIALPQDFEFSTEIALLTSHINAGGHLGNDALISLLNEARARFLQSREIPEDSGEGWSVVNADLAVRYRGEGFYGDVVAVEVAAGDFHRCGFDLFYRVTERHTGRAIAEAKTAHIVIDVVTRKALDVPLPVKARLKAE